MLLRLLYAFGQFPEHKMVVYVHFVQLYGQFLGEYICQSPYLPITGSLFSLFLNSK